MCQCLPQNADQHVTDLSGHTRRTQSKTPQRVPDVYVHGIRLRQITVIHRHRTIPPHPTPNNTSPTDTEPTQSAHDFTWMVKVLHATANEEKTREQDEPFKKGLRTLMYYTPLLINTTYSRSTNSLQFHWAPKPPKWKSSWQPVGTNTAEIESSCNHIWARRSPK